MSSDFSTLCSAQPGIGGVDAQRTYADTQGALSGLDQTTARASIRLNRTERIRSKVNRQDPATEFAESRFNETKPLH
jgi:hypothetical protein